MASVEIHQCDTSRPLRIAGFNVNVTGPAFQRREDNGVDKPDDRSIHPVSVSRWYGFIATLILADDLQLESFGRFFQHALGRFRFLSRSWISESGATLIFSGRASSADISSIATRSLGSAMATTRHPSSSRSGTRCIGTSDPPDGFEQFVQVRP